MTPNTLLACLMLPAMACGVAKPPAVSPRPVPAVASIAPITPITPPPAGAQGDVAARVDSEDITIAQLDHRIDTNVKAEIAALPDDEQAYRLAEERMKLLRGMIDDRILIVVARRSRIEVPEDSIDRAIEQVAAHNQITVADLEKSITNAGFTMAEYREDVRGQQLLAGLYQLERSRPDEPALDTRHRLLARYGPASNVVIGVTMPASSPGSGLLDASALLTVEDLVPIFGRRLPVFSAKRLVDLPTSPTYDTRHLQAVGTGESFDVAIRVWRGSTTMIDAAWKTLHSDLRPIKNTLLATESFVVHDPRGFRGFGFVDRAASVVVLVSCGGDLCRTEEETLAVARSVHGRLDRLVRK